MSKHKKKIGSWLLSWTEGVSCHCEGKCVSDFSCCFPGLKAEREVRIKFLNCFIDGNAYNMNAMRAMFISCLIDKTGSNFLASIIVEDFMRMFGNA